ncbi:MAG: diadenylate cyclase [Planctomycetota bacterium]
MILHYAKLLFEVLLVALVYYGFIRHLQRTRGGGLLAGFIVLLLMTIGGFALVIGLLELPHLQKLADAALPALSIALLIIFQPELRLAISRLGSIKPLRIMQRFFGSATPHHTSRVVDAILNACERLSRGHTGALIVVQRIEGIEGFAVGGCKLDAEVTSRLLETIFFDGTSLHDGAVMIIDGRCMFAGCKLPVSASNAQVRQRRLGTRHSAALGISEESDALVIVVSEESGRISIAKQGKIEIGVSLDDLRHEISEGLETQFKRPNTEPSQKMDHAELQPALANEGEADISLESRDEDVA